MQDNRHISALIKLLDDSDPEVFDHVHDKLVDLGLEAVPFLEAAWAESPDPVLQHRIEDCIQLIQQNEVVIALNQWLKEDRKDLLEACFILARVQYPELNEQELINRIEEIKRDAWLDMSLEMSPLEKVKVLNNVFFNKHGFKGNTTNYHDPVNSYLNKVLESKKGNQISLAVIYMLIAQKLDIPIYGVNLPQHFVLAYHDPAVDLPSHYDTQDGVVFYINPFNRGFVFRKKDIDHFLKQLNLEPQPAYYRPCSHVEILQRMVRNLINAYEKQKRDGNQDKIKILNVLLMILEENQNPSVQ